MYPVGAGRSFGVSDFISLKDEYRNMAGGVLPLTNDPMPNINTNKQGWGTDAAGTDLTEGDKYKDLINIKGAKFLDLTRSSSMKIDDADDLKDALKEYDVEMSIAFNDNPDNDEFRKAYIVVITGLKDKGETPVTPTTGAVRFSSDLSSKDGAIADGSKVEVLASGNVTATFTLEKPDWAHALGTAGNDVAIKYDVLVDGEVYAHVTTPLANVGYGTAGLAPNASSASKITAYVHSGLDVNTAATLSQADAKGHKVELVITEVDWKNAIVEYTLDGTTVKNTEPAKSGTTYLSTSTPARFEFTIGGLSGRPAGKYTLSGVDTDGLAVEKYTNLTATDLSSKTTSADSFKAKGGEKVIVAITPDAPVTKTWDLKAKFGESGTAATSLAGGLEHITSGIPANYAGSEAKLSVEFAPTGTVQDGAIADLTFQISYLDQITDGLIWAYDVTYKVNDNTAETVRLELGSRTGPVASVSLGKVTEDILVTVTEVKPVKADYYALSATGDENELKVKYNGTIEAVERGSIGSLPADAQVTFKDDTLIITFPTALTANTTLDIDAAVKIGGKWAKQCTIDYTHTTTSWGTPDHAG